MGGSEFGVSSHPPIPAHPPDLLLWSCDAARRWDKSSRHGNERWMMDIEAMRARGLALRKALFGEATVEKRMTAAGAFGQPLQDMINGYAYGDLWQRPGLSP